MNDLFAQAKSILVVCVSDIDVDVIRTFQEVLERKAPHAQIVFENAQSLSTCKLILLS